VNEQMLTEKTGSLPANPFSRTPYFLAATLDRRPVFLSLPRPPKNRRGEIFGTGKQAVVSAPQFQDSTVKR
jgi:hypothetical protein